MAQSRAHYVGFSLVNKSDASEFGRLVAAAQNAFHKGVIDQTASPGVMVGWRHSFAIPTQQAEGPARHKEANELKARLEKWLKAQQSTVATEIYWEDDSVRSAEFKPNP